MEGEASYNEKNSANYQPREGWKYFRELVSDKWMQSFLNVVELETGQRDLTYVVAVTKMNGTQEEKAQFENLEILRGRFKKHGSELKIKIVNLEDILIGFNDRLREKETPALEATEVGRLLQLFNAADFKITKNGEEIGGRNATAR